MTQDLTGQDCPAFRTWGTEDGYWFAHDPRTLELTVYRDDHVIGITRCGDDEIGDCFADIVAYDRNAALNIAPGGEP